MTNKEVKQLWLESGMTLVVEYFSGSKGEWIASFPVFISYLKYRFANDQDFSIINDKVKLIWLDNDKTIELEVTHPDGQWIDVYPKNNFFHKSLIYRIKPGQIYTEKEDESEISSIEIGLSEKTNDQKVLSSKSYFEISNACDNIKSMLLDKNKKYGDSALNPIRVFSKLDSGEQLNVRIDDKLSRIRNMQTDDIEDSIVDLIGYLILKKIHQNRSGENE